MSIKPMKRAGWNQGVFAQSATQKEELGALRILRDGRKFRYAKAGASALAAGKLAVAAAVGATVMNEACVAAHLAGEMIFTETITAGTAYAENYFAGGYLQINDVTGEGHQYKITSSSAVTAAGTSITLTLDEPIRVALAINSEFTIVHSPWMATVESATLGLPVGVTPIVVTAAYFYWAQTGGPAVALSGNADAVGKPLFQSTSTAGALSGADTASYYPQVAIAMGTVGVATEYKPVMLNLD
jgi:hypothetical protein